MDTAIVNVPRRGSFNFWIVDACFPGRGRDYDGQLNSWMGGRIGDTLDREVGVWMIDACFPDGHR